MSWFYLGKLLEGKKDKRAFQAISATKTPQACAFPIKKDPIDSVILYLHPFIFVFLPQLHPVNCQSQEFHEKKLQKMTSMKIACQGNLHFFPSLAEILGPQTCTVSFGSAISVACGRHATRPVWRAVQEPRWWGSTRQRSTWKNHGIGTWGLCGILNHAWNDPAVLSTYIWSTVWTDSMPWFVCFFVTADWLGNTWLHAN